MNSPPPPSFTLPPLKSNGQYPVTPDDSPNVDESGDVAKDYISAKVRSKGKERAVEVGEAVPEVRISMYVRLFEGELLWTATSYSNLAHYRSTTEGPEMITTVLASESYLFTPREIWVLNHIVSLPCESSQLAHGMSILC